MTPIQPFRSRHAENSPDSDLAALRLLARPHSSLVVGVTVTSVLLTILEIVVIATISILAGQAITGTVRLPMLPELTTSSFLIIAAASVVAKVGLDLWNTKLYATLMFRFEAHMRTEIAELQAACSWSVIEDSDTGSIQSLLWTAVPRSRDGLAQLMGILTNLTSLILMLIATLLTAGWIVVPIALSLVVVGLILKPLIRASRNASANLNTHYRGYSRSLNESIAMSRESRVLGVQDIVAERLSDAGRAAAESVRQQTLYSQLLAKGYTDILYVAVIIGLAIIAGSNIRNPAPLMALVLLLYRSLGYGQGLQASLQAFATTGPFIREVNSWIRVLRSNGETDTCTRHFDRFESMDLRGAELVYPNGHTGIANVTLSIKYGEAVALVGPSGSGKSSLVSMLLALRNQTDGDVLMNGIPFESVDKRAWRRNLAFVPQDNLLFDANILENVRCWRDISEDRVVESLKQAHILDDVLAMQNGFLTEVGEGGKRLSGGQRQRICIARALAGDPTLLILDEPTSALDPASEQAVKSTLQAIKGTVTIIIIAHRMTTITLCDRVLVLDMGQLVADGSPEVVATNSSFFARALALSDGAS